MRTLIVVCFVVMTLLLYPTLGQAQLRSRNEASLGMTDNANLEQTEEDSDFFLSLSSSNTYKEQKHLFGLRLGYVDYMNENINDAFSWRLSDRWQNSTHSWAFTGALLGQKFTSSEPGITESAFDFIGWDFNAEREHDLNPRSKLNFGPGLSGRYYTGALTRSDHTLYGFIGIEHEATSRLLFGGRAELGFLGSSESEFSRRYLDLSANASVDLNSGWIWYNEVGLRQSYFTDRTASNDTIVGRLRGSRSAIGQRTDMERYSYVYLYTDATRKLAEDIDGGVSFRHSSQTSRSGFQDYSANELLAHASLTF
ncbi:MAG: hypothetical protein NDI61_07445 [Bdellovibrionaceae bacterium]|nr:hypothetical protein [Pseudobdellovibrionaceae bacterium]